MNNPNSNNDPIGKALNLSPITTSNAVQNMLEEATNDSANKDFEMARSNIVVLMDSATSAIEELSVVARGSQHPRAYEVLAKLIDSSANLSKNLLELQSKIRDIDSANTSATNQGGAMSVNNAIFVGSTADLQNLIKESSKSIKDIDHD